MMEDYSQIQSAGRKRSLWSTVGSALLGGVALAVTGGAAAPIVAGLMAGGGAFAGGHIGNWLAGKTNIGGSGKLTGTTWYKSLGKNLGSKIKEGITTGAVKSAITTTLTAGTGKLLGKALSKGGKAAEGAGKGATATKDTNALARLFKGGEKAHEYSDSLFGKIGETIDFKGSAVGGFFDKASSASHRFITDKKLQKLQGGDKLIYKSGDELNLIGTDVAPSRIGKSDVPDLESLYADTAGMEGIYNVDTDELSRAGGTTTGTFDADELYDWEGDIEELWSPSGVGRTKSAHQLSQEKYDLARRQISALEGFLAENPEYMTGMKGQTLWGKGAGITGMGDDVQTTRAVWHNRLFGD